jgi:hypothetical protein
VQVLRLKTRRIQLRELVNVGNIASCGRLEEKKKGKYLNRFPFALGWSVHGNRSAVLLHFETRKLTVVHFTSDRNVV